MITAEQQQVVFCFHPASLTSHLLVQLLALGVPDCCGRKTVGFALEDLGYESSISRFDSFYFIQ